MARPVFKPVADHALLIELSQEISDDVSAMVIELDQQITALSIQGIVETVPALVNLLLVFDPLVTSSEQVQKAVETLLPVKAPGKKETKSHLIPICYDPEFSPDLSLVSQKTGLSPEKIATIHAGAIFKVGMYGFAPGYAYLTGLPDAIQLPRKPQPVRDVPAGSVIIAGGQCLITTITMPTGWWIIGQSPAKIMRDDPEQPFLFSVGDTMQFQPVDKEALE